MLFLLSQKSRLFPGPFPGPNLWASQLTAVKKWQEILGNRGVYLQVFICSCTPCVPAMFQDVGRLRQDEDGREREKGSNSKQR